MDIVGMFLAIPRSQESKMTVNLAIFSADQTSCVAVEWPRPRQTGRAWLRRAVRPARICVGTGLPPIPCLVCWRTRTFRCKRV
jgi:hypothetical protein